MFKKKYINEWSIKIIDLHKAKSMVDNYEENMIQLLTELLGLTSVSDEEYENKKNYLKFNGVKDSDIFEILKIASKELEDKYK